LFCSFVFDFEVM